MIMRYGKHEGKTLAWCKKNDPDHLRALATTDIPFPQMKTAILYWWADELLTEDSRKGRAERRRRRFLAG